MHVKKHLVSLLIPNIIVSHFHSILMYLFTALLLQQISAYNEIELLQLYGVVLHNFNIENLINEGIESNKAVHYLTELIYKHGFVVIKDVDISANTLLKISQKFGDISNFKQGKLTQHFGTPHHLISSISNNPFFGNAYGGGAWHNDGFFQFELHDIVLQYTVYAIDKKYGTQIISSKNILQLLEVKHKYFFDLLHNVSIINVVDKVQHSLIMQHPITGTEFIYIARLFVYHKDTYKLMINDRILDNIESKNILFKIESFVENECRENGFIYITENNSGDLLIRDNLAFIHRSHPSSFDTNGGSLKLLWRVDIKQNNIPWMDF
eukprot:475075_1